MVYGKKQIEEKTGRNVKYVSRVRKRKIASDNASTHTPLSIRIHINRIWEIGNAPLLSVDFSQHQMHPQAQVHQTREENHCVNRKTRWARLNFIDKGHGRTREWGSESEVVSRGLWVRFRVYVKPTVGPLTNLVISNWPSFSISPMKSISV